MKTIEYKLLSRDDKDIHNYINKSKWRLKIEKTSLHYVKPTTPLQFVSRFPKSGPTYRRQVVNPRPQTPQGQSVAKPETPL